MWLPSEVMYSFLSLSNPLFSTPSGVDGALLFFLSFILKKYIVSYSSISDFSNSSKCLEKLMTAVLGSIGNCACLCSTWNDWLWLRTDWLNGPFDVFFTRLVYLWSSVLWLICDCCRTISVFLAILEFLFLSSTTVCLWLVKTLEKLLFLMWPIAWGAPLLFIFCLFYVLEALYICPFDELAFCYLGEMAWDGLC